MVDISESKGGIYNKDGLHVEKVLDYKKKNRTLKGYGGVKEISNEDLLKLNVDVLVPAALENVITKDNAEEIKAKYIIEMANGPVTPEADEILYKNKIISFPDVLSNAGGVTTSYFEWVQNNMGYYWKKEEVFEKLKVIMDKAFMEVWTRYKERKTSLRMAAYMGAVDRVVKAMRLKGKLK